MKGNPRICGKDRPAMIRGLSMSDVERFSETIDMTKYKTPKPSRILKANPFR